MKKILTDIRYLLLITVILAIILYSMIKGASSGKIITKELEKEVHSIEDANNISGLKLGEVEGLGKIISIKAYKGTEHITFDKSELIVSYTSGNRLDYFLGVEEDEKTIKDIGKFKNITYKTSKSTINGKEEIVKLINFKDNENGYVLILIGDLSEDDIESKINSLCD